MSCISSNFSSFFLNSLNDPSEFAKYLSNGELKVSAFEDFQAFGAQQQQQQQQQHQQYSLQQQQHYHNNNNNNVNSTIGAGGVANTAGGAHSNNVDVFSGSGVAPMDTNNYTHPVTTAAAATAHHPHHTHYGHTPSSAPHNSSFHTNSPLPNHNAPNYAPQRWPPSAAGVNTAPPHNNQAHPQQHTGTPTAAAAAVSHHHNSHQAGAQHFDGSFEFLKYLRHSNDFNAGGTNGASDSQSDASNTSSSTNPAHGNPQQQQQASASSTSSSLIDLDSSTTHKSRSSRKVAALLSSVSRASNSLDSTALDVFDHDSKHTIFDLHHHMTNSSNSNESSLEMSNLAFPNSHLNASNSNTSSEGAAAGSSDFSLINASSTSGAPKPLANVIIKDNFDVHPSHKVEEGIFQHMNKLPPKKKENLKQLGVRFTGQMTLNDKSIVVDNFVKFCQEYDIKDHRPYLSLNQSGLNKPEQIKFARYLGQGLPTFTLFCIYSNFKNLFCTKRTEIYTKDGYNLPYILDKTKRFLSNTTAGGTPSKQNHSAPTPTTSTTATPPPPTIQPLTTTTTIQPTYSQQPLTQTPMTMGPTG